MRDETILWVMTDLEGGDRLTDHATDAGGLTRYGLTRSFLADLPGDLGVARDPTDVTGQQAIEAYRWLWSKVRGDELPGPVAVVVFDGAVQHGRAVAARMLQAEVRALIDGVLGPKTVEATAKRAAAHPRGAVGLAEDVIWRRLKLYSVRAQASRTQGLPNLPGWVNRMVLVRDRIVGMPRTGRT